MRASKAERTKNLRYKRPALASLGYEPINETLNEIEEACANIHWFIDQDDETLINALEGDEDEAMEFKLAFADLEGKADQLRTSLNDNWNWLADWDGGRMRQFDDCTVALVGNRYRLVGYDFEEEDYSSLTGYEPDLAFAEAGKRLMRLTKAEMISTIGQCVGTLIAFLDLRQQYDYLKATFDILRDENTSVLQRVKEIQAAYEAANAAGWDSWHEEVKDFDRLLSCLPERAWVE